MTSLKACIPKFTSCNTSVYENSCEPKGFYEFCGKLNHDYLEVEAGLPRPGPGQPCSFALSVSPVFYSCSLDFRLWSTTYFHLTLHVHSAWSLEDSFYLINACGLHDYKNNSQHLLLSSVKTQRWRVTCPRKTGFGCQYPLNLWSNKFDLKTFSHMLQKVSHKH